jgi:hypothetical protein
MHCKSAMRRAPNADKMMAVSVSQWVIIIPITKINVVNDFVLLPNLIQSGTAHRGETVRVCTENLRQQESLAVTTAR